MITLRRGGMEDLPIMEAILAACGMATEIDPRECLVADDDGCVVGFGRIELAEGQAYLRPIVTAPKHRHRGIGRQLLSGLVAGRDELRVVARGDAVGFYLSVGFATMGWDAVSGSFRQGCEECPDLAGCKPLPMIYRGGLEQ